MAQANDTKISFSLNSLTVSRETPDDLAYVEVAFRPWTADANNTVGPFNGLRLTAHHRINNEPTVAPQVEFVPFSAHNAPGVHDLIQGALKSLGLPEDALVAHGRDGSTVVPQFSNKGIMWRGSDATAVLILPPPHTTPDGEMVFALGMLPDGNLAVVSDMADLGHTTNGALNFWSGENPYTAHRAPGM